MSSKAPLEPFLDNVSNAVLDYGADAADELERAVSEALGPSQAARYADGVWRQVQPALERALDRWEQYVLAQTPAPDVVARGRAQAEALQAAHLAQEAEKKMAHQLRQLAALRKLREQLAIQWEARATEDTELRKACAVAGELAAMTDKVEPLAGKWAEAENVERRLKDVLEARQKRQKTQEEGNE